MAGVELVGGAFLGAAFQVALERLASADFKHYFRGKSRMEDLLKKLEITLLSVNQVLEDAEEKQYSNSNVKRWLDELKDAVYIADDLLDDIAYEATHQKLEAQSQTATAKVRGFFTSLVNQFDTQIEDRIQEVLGNLEFLAKKKNEFGLKEGSGGARFRGKMSNRLPSASLLGETTIYGRDGDKEEIIKFLVSDSDASGRRVSTIGIVGMGGLGKTTLAQLVYNHPGMQQQFQLKAWVCVAEDFDVERLTKTILSALGCSTTGNEDLNQLQLKLKDILLEKKFLLVLDDVWNQDRTLWETLQAPFLYGASGSKVVITTRNKEVALVMQAKVHPLQLLEKEDGWKLFAKYAFNDKDAATNNTNLEPLGRKIVDKCHGLPLAIKSLGALVGRELSEKHWGEILESDIWQLPDDKSNIISALRLSYHYLPSHLKRCFAFCSIYPKDYPISKDDMIRLWMAEGLLDCRQGTKSEEELGDEFCTDLESRSFFQEQDSDYFLMHDLVNDLAKSVLGEFCVRIEEDKVPDISTKIREILKYLGMFKYLRVLPQITVGKHSGSSIKQLGTLNKLGGHLSISELENINDAMDAREAKMRDKKYLYLLELEWKEHEDSQNERSVLEAFQPHVNLKELRITNYGGSSLVDWFDAPYLPNLVSLRLSGCKYCFSLPPLGQLPSLKSLLIIGLEGIKKIGAEFYGNNSSTAAFRSLEYLSFKNMGEWEEWMHFEGECFLCLQNLRLDSCPRLTKSLPPDLTSLRILRIDDCQGLEPSLPKDCWMQQILVTNPNLEKLYLNVCPKLVSFPSYEISAPKLEDLFIGDRRLKELWFRNCPHLKYLRLSNCPELESFHKEGLPSTLLNLEINHCPKLIACSKEWGLCRLHSLRILTVGGDFENVESFPVESLLPPNLTNLSFQGCSNLKTINYKGLLHLTSLNSLTILDCPSLQCLPEQVLPNPMRLIIWGNCPILKQRYNKENGQDWPKISHIPYVHI